MMARLYSAAGQPGQFMLGGRLVTLQDWREDFMYDTIRIPWWQKYVEPARFAFFWLKVRLYIRPKLLVKHLWWGGALPPCAKERRNYEP